MPAFTLSRRRAVVVVACALGFVLAASRLLSAPATPSGAATGAPIQPARRASVPRALVVDVEGAVRRPGVYRLQSGARIADAIALAGGATRHADGALVNLAAPVADGEQVLVPRIGSGGAAATEPPGSTTAPVDLNSATVEQLDELPGIGPVTAQKIVDFRSEHGPFTSVDQLDAISGIGPTRIDNLRGHVLP